MRGAELRELARAAARAAPAGATVNVRSTTAVGGFDAVPRPMLPVAPGRTLTGRCLRPPSGVTLVVGAITAGGVGTGAAAPPPLQRRGSRCLRVVEDLDRIGEVVADHRVGAPVAVDVRGLGGDDGRERGVLVAEQRDVGAAVEPAEAVAGVGERAAVRR